MKVLLTRLALWWINRQLMRDPAYYEGWKANIAMSMYDEYRLELDRNRLYGEHMNIHTVCNKGADRFLALLRK